MKTVENYNFDTNYSSNLLVFAKRVASMLYKNTFNKNINWENPKNLNEKINWLAFNTDTEKWSVLADKYSVQEYVKEKGLGFLLNPIYEKWDNIEDINFNNLPDSFAIKTNCGCGDTIIVKNKNEQNISILKEKFKNTLLDRFGIITAEPHYLRIKPCIFAEKLLEGEIIDYKVWCFNGKPYCIQTISNRDKDKKDMNIFDTKWEEKRTWLNPYYQNKNTIEKPKQLNEILQYAEILAEGFPQVRVDFYIKENKVIFGEMTFTAACGRLVSFTNEALDKMGKEIILTKDKK